MSADNYYLVRKHPGGGFVALMGFASDDSEPEVRLNRQYEIHPTAEHALFSVLNEYAEYGHSIHPECDPIAPDPVPLDQILITVDEVDFELLIEHDPGRDEPGKFPSFYLPSGSRTLQSILDAVRNRIEGDV